jgi:hypothetical protein
MLQDSTRTVHDWSLGNIFEHSNVGANFTCSIINLPTVNNTSYKITLLINQPLKNTYYANYIVINNIITPIAIWYENGIANFNIATLTKLLVQEITVYYSNNAWKIFTKGTNYY